MVAVDGTVVVGAAWLKPREGVELRPPSDRPVEVVLVWPKPAIPGAAAVVNGVLPNRPAVVVVVVVVVGAPVVEAVVAAGVAPKPTAVGSRLLEVTAAVMCVDEGAVLPAKDGTAAVEAGTVMDAVVVLVVSVAGVCPGTDVVNVGMPMLGAVTVAVAVGVAAPKLMVADGVVLNAGADVDAGTPN